MTTAGLYETSGDWLYDVGLPGKTESAAHRPASPGKGGLGTFAPPLDRTGNSVKGQLAARFLSRKVWDSTCSCFSRHPVRSRAPSATEANGDAGDHGLKHISTTITTTSSNEA